MSEVYLTKEYWNGLIKMSLSKFFILRVLQDEPLHGYEISKRIAEMTKGCCAPTEGALYPVLRDFEKGRYLTCEIQIVNGRRRNVYSTTCKGRDAYRVAVEAWQETAQKLVQAGKALSDEGGNPGEC